ncbi:MAG: diguanylate cyclase [Armatimonadetes bacterium]|nr:diguanylate cyclase [Armatimonadota bacterium]
MTRRTKTSVEAKLCILTIATFFTVMLGVGHLALNEHRSVLMEQKQEAYQAVTRALALSAGQLVSGKDSRLIETVSSRVKNRHMDIEYLIVADEHGHTLFAESKNLPKKPFSPGMRWWFVARRIMGYGGIDPEDIYSVTMPSALDNGEPVSFTVGFRLAQAKEMMDVAQSKVLLGMAVGLMVGVICAVLMGRSMSSALRSLIRGAKAVASGNYAYRISTKSEDEIGQLAEAFNFMVETLANSREQLIERANTDSLTGLYNHRYLQERLGIEVSRASRYNRSVSLLMIDIDFFKSFNDSHGHPAGDEALRDLSQVIAHNVRETDVAVRYGGEEFAVILPETNLPEAMITAERIRQSVEDHAFGVGGEENVKLTASIGVAEYPSQCSDRAGLILSSDVALYQAKALGRNRVICYDAEMADSPRTDPYKLYVLLHSQDLPTMEALADAVDAKFKYPAGHSKAVARLASETARRLGMPESECSSVYLAALLRDIGQTAISDGILSKAGTLTDNERAAISAHPLVGHAIVQQAPHLCSVLPAIMHHHERFDGNGYPSHLSGMEIPLPARVLTVADAYQSMITLRPHRKQMTPVEAKEELVQKSSTQFDPKVVEVFLGVLADEEAGKLAA